MTSSAPRASGVYQIRCVPTGKIYVGSAVNLRERLYRHRRALRRGKHVNRYLQQAWDKYGEESFEFSVLEYVERGGLLAAEQFWIDQLNCTNREKGFNIFDTAGSPGDRFAQIWEGFVNPVGNEVTISNLHDFCRQNGLNFTAMRNLAKGTNKLKSHKGWSHRNSVRQRDYVKTYTGFIDPNGNLTEPFTNLAEFCRQHSLDKTHMVAVAHGRICSHRGWTHIFGRAPQNYKTHIGFINPNGERIMIINLAEFCRENGLHPVKMRQLKTGQIQRYKGWTWREEEEHDQ